MSIHWRFMYWVIDYHSELFIIFNTYGIINSLPPWIYDGHVKSTIFTLNLQNRNLSTCSGVAPMIMNKTLPARGQPKFKLWFGYITWVNVDPGLCGHDASLGHKELT